MSAATCIPQVQNACICISARISIIHQIAFGCDVTPWPFVANKGVKSKLESWLLCVFALQINTENSKNNFVWIFLIFLKAKFSVWSSVYFDLTIKE